MKKIIAGKLFDTNTATKKAEWDNDCLYGDAHFISETLYQKVNGTYFYTALQVLLQNMRRGTEITVLIPVTLFRFRTQKQRLGLLKRKHPIAILRFIANKYGRKSILRPFKKNIFS